RFTDGLWEVIKKYTIVNDVKTNSYLPGIAASKVNNVSYSSDISELDQLYTSIQTFRGAHNTAYCLFVGEERYCNYWTMYGEPPQLNRMRKFFGNDIYKQMTGGNGPKYWVVKAIGFTCKDCSAFIDEKMISLIKERSLQSEKKNKLLI
ncbi:MAG: hypothetical protein NT022_12870, partial [Deltaproteobacteria bacterium]|nr:hypothetical protein [Deltaproteobacteria bacterium]